MDIGAYPDVSTGLQRKGNNSTGIKAQRTH